MTLPPEHELACRELVELVTDWLEGALSPAERDRFEAHLATCRYCRAYVEQLRQVLRVARRIGRRVDAAALPPEARAALVEAFRGYPSRRNGRGGA
jgi:anti-sigma factor RsiW